MIYLNFLNAPSGGGLQNSASFLQTLVSQNVNLDDFTCFVLKGTILEKLCLENSIRHFSVKRGVLSKTLFELFAIFKLKKGETVFATFGPPLLFTNGYTCNVGGMAISNVFYPEVKFWDYLPLFSKLLKKIKDRYRVSRYKKLDIWIFETQLLADKAINNYCFPQDRVHVIKMAPSALVSVDYIDRSIDYGLDRSKKYILMLCSAHPNKRHHLLPKLASKLKAHGTDDVVFIFTTNDNKYYEGVELTIRELNVENFFKNVGPVAPENVATLINAVDYVMNISLLESFSNNFVEAWAMQKPLITVREEWAFSAAKQAALYLDIKYGEIDLHSFYSALSSNALDVVRHGAEILKEYPTATEKNIQYLDLIKKASEVGSLSPKIRRRISL